MYVFLILNYEATKYKDAGVVGIDVAGCSQSADEKYSPNLEKLFQVVFILLKFYHFLIFIKKNLMKIHRKLPNVDYIELLMPGKMEMQNRLLMYVVNFKNLSNYF